MKISVIIPVYNVELYVRRCLESVIMQDNGGTDLECILVDDCGQDRSMEIVRQMVADYQGPIHFVLLSHEHNRGLSAARNTGMDVATGDYILFVDSDDWLSADAISKFVDSLQKHPDMDVVIGNHYDRRAENLFYETDRNIEFDNYQARKFLVTYKEGACAAWNKLVKTQIAKNNRFLEGSIFEDKPWTYSVFKEVKHALLIPDRTYTYENDHSHSILGSLTNRTNVSQHVDSIVRVGNAILDAPYWDLFADSVFFFWHYYFVAYRFQYEHHIESDNCRQLRQLRNRLIQTSFKAGRWFLAFFIFTWTFPPTAYLFNNGVVRRHYDSIMKSSSRIAHFFERFHANH